MTMIYSNPARESEVGALPDVEVFEVTHADAYAQAQAIAQNRVAPKWMTLPGWYWRTWNAANGSVFHTPNGDSIGPFATEAEAIADAQAGEWSGAECHAHPACWIDDATGEHVNAYTLDRTSASELPRCVLAMRCYCVGHARGNPASEPCDTSEVQP